MSTTITQFEVSSPEELREAIAKAEQKNGAGFASVRVFGPDILARQFRLSDLAPKEIQGALRLEALEVFSLSTDEIELSYQILATHDKEVKGFFVAMPRQRLLEYLDSFKASRLIPIGLTSSAIGALDDLLSQEKKVGRDFCLVNFLRPQVINIVVFVDGEPILLREIFCDADTDFEGKIQDSLKYCCSRSTRKSFEQIVFSGDSAGKEAMISRLNEFTVPDIDSAPVEAKTWGIKLGGLNLFYPFSPSREERRSMMLGIHMALVAAVIFAAMVGLRLSKTQAGIERVRSSFKPAEYQRAIELQEKVRLAGHAQ